MLTESDREALNRIRMEWTESEWSVNGSRGMDVLLEAIAAHFLAAGLERAARVCDSLPSERGSACAIAIRAIK